MPSKIRYVGILDPSELIELKNLSLGVNGDLEFGR